MPRICPVCNTRYDEGETFCARDGTELVGAGHGHAGAMIGTTVADRYEVLEQIATGGMGVVYKARQKMLDRYVALKVLPRELSNDPDTERRFFNEARAISQLRHPHIVTLFDFGRTADRRLFIAMEYINGEPLAVHIENRPLPLGSAVRIADQVLDALAEAHRAGIVHRDIKPDNVMLEVRGGQLHVRLLDFGIAKSDIDTARLTKTGIVFGTPEYISPEQVVGDPIDLRADLYAVGLLLFEMLSGHRPFGGSGSAIAYKHAHDPVPSLLERYTDLDVPVAIDALIYRLMAKDPDARPASAEAVRTLLMEAAIETEGLFGSGPWSSLGALGPDLLPPLDDAGSARNLPPTVSARSGDEAALPVPPPPPPPGMLPPAEVVTGPPPVVEPPRPDPSYNSIDRVLGPRPPRPSVDHTPTLQAPAELFQRRPASRRPLVLGGVLALIGLGSLAASLWVDRPFAGSPLQSRPAPAAPMAVAETPSTPPVYGANVIDGLTSTLRPAPVAAALRAEVDLAILPSPTIEGLDDVADGEPLRPRVAETRQALERLAPDDPARLGLMGRIADLEWAAANAVYAVEMQRYSAETTAYLEGRRDAAPAPPRPAYGDAVIAYERLVEEAPARRTGRVLGHLAHGLMAAGRTKAGIARWGELVDEHPDSALALRGRLVLAGHAFAADAFDTAETHYTIVARDGDARMQRYARFMLAYVELALGRDEAAVDRLHALLDALRDAGPGAEPFRGQALDALTIAYSRVPAGRRQAIGYFRGLGGEALARRQLRLLAMAYAARGDAAEAAASWRAVVDDLETPVKEPGDRAEVLVKLAEQEAAAGRAEAADAILSGPLDRCRPLADTPVGLHCQVTRGNALRTAGRVDEAAAALKPVADRQTTADDSEAPFVAEARFRLAEMARTRFDAMPADAPRAAAMAEVDAAYARVAEVEIARWRVAADYRRGQLHLGHAERIAAGPEADLRGAEIDSARARALEHFTRAEKLAGTASVETRWARAAAEQRAALARTP